MTAAIKIVITPTGRKISLSANATVNGWLTK